MGYVREADALAGMRPPLAEYASCAMAANYGRAGRRADSALHLAQAANLRQKDDIPAPDMRILKRRGFLLAPTAYAPPLSVRNSALKSQISRVGTGAAGVRKTGK